MKNYTFEGIRRLQLEKNAFTWLEGIDGDPREYGTIVGYFPKGKSYILWDLGNVITLVTKKYWEQYGK